MAIAAAHQLIDHSSAWRAGEAAAWYRDAFTLEQRHLDALEQALDGVHRKGLGLDDLDDLGHGRRQGFDLGAVEEEELDLCHVRAASENTGPFDRVPLIRG